MNFLAHHIVSIYPDNYYYNLGLTLPDILAMQNSRCRVNLKIVDGLLNTYKEDEDLIFLLNGMKVHLLLDRWFHNSDNFYILLKKGAEIVDNQSLPIHQFVEILFDIFLDKKDKNYAKSLIKTYKDERIDLLLNKIDKFWEIDRLNFSKLREYISKGIFYKTYLNDKSLFELLKKLSFKINKKVTIENIDHMKKIIADTKNYLAKDFEKLYEELIIYSKEIQLNLKVNIG